MTRPTQLVWFKRDLRIADHAPLAEAAACGPVICLYVFEPSLLAHPEFSHAHQVFIDVSLRDLRRALRARGGDLVVRRGEVPAVFEALRLEHPFEAIWAHEETGTWASYQRDRRVRAWARAHGVPLRELPSGGVVRRLASRDGWAERWRRRMRAPPAPTPERLAAPDLPAGEIPGPRALGVTGDPKPLAPQGGERRAHETLRSFLDERGRNYRSEMSSPVTAFESSSRLSPHLAWGTLSLRQVYRATEARRAELRAEPRDEDRPWLASLASFGSRLRWHDHFVQKLEDEPELEFRNANRGFDGLREDAFDAERFDAWTEGRTGYPMVDACMRCLHATGWLNFRMRAMLVSFASYHLWLHWRPTGSFLARHWIDIEPGIHWPQMQMQSGVTGINTVRIYSPRKQVEDHDPHGRFVRRWLPELEGVPDAHLAEPHTMPPMMAQMVGCVIGRDYPAPVVDPRTAYTEARRRMTEAKRSPAVRARVAGVLERHGSRATPAGRRGGRRSR